jgi:V8-like Glu-specific endopeptidase
MRYLLAVTVVFALILPTVLPSQTNRHVLVNRDMTVEQMKKTMTSLRTEVKSRIFLEQLSEQHPDATDADRKYLREVYGIKTTPEYEQWTIDDLNLSIQELDLTISESAVVYGGNDLMEIYLSPPVNPAPGERYVTNEQILKVAKSVVAIVSKDDLHENNGVWTLDTRPFVEVYYGFGPLCQSERFHSAPTTTVKGTGFLIASNVIATAGHVVSSSSSGYDEFLNSVYFVFDFAMQADGTPRTTFSDNEVFKGEAVLADHSDASGDWALIRLSGSPGRVALPFRKMGQVENGKPVYMIGHPNGMTQKFAGNATIRDNSACFHFTTDLDTYPYNSGSPVFNAETHIVEGILVRDIGSFERFCGCWTTESYTEQMGPVSAGATRTTAFVGVLRNPESIVVRCKVPIGTLKTINNDTVILFQNQVQQLPYHDLGIELLVSADCNHRYFPGRGEIWEIVSIPNERRVEMQKVCSP